MKVFYRHAVFRKPTYRARHFCSEEQLYANANLGLNMLGGTG